MNLHLCPVCGYDGLLEPAYDEFGGGSFEICASCGFEYGYDDGSEGVTHEEYRNRWLADGAQWFDPETRHDWDLTIQLARLGIIRDTDDDAAEAGN